MKNDPERAAAEIAAMLPALREAGVEKAVISYDNEWESQIECVFPDMPEDLRNRLERHARDLLPEDWDEGAGSDGTIIIDTARCAMEIEHEWHVTTEEEENLRYSLESPGKAIPVRRQAQAALVRIAALLDSLPDANAGEIRIQYEGCNDTGFFEHIEPSDLPEPVESELAECHRALLPDGWDEEDGSYGTIVIDPARAAVWIHHVRRVPDTENERRTYGLF
jgi:cation transport regulator ChaB